MATGVATAGNVTMTFDEAVNVVGNVVINDVILPLSPVATNAYTATYTGLTHTTTYPVTAVY